MAGDCQKKVPKKDNISVLAVQNDSLTLS